MKKFEITFTNDTASGIYSANLVHAESAEQATAYYTAEGYTVIGCRETMNDPKPGQPVTVIPEDWEAPVEKINATNYTITKNPQYNSVEVTFNEKPAEAVRAALKSLRFRWNSVKKCWYGYATEDDTRKAIESADTCEAVCKELPADKSINVGTLYEGWQGGQYHEWRSDAELKALIAADLKRAGIKATIRQNPAGMLTSITVTVKGSAKDVKTFEEWQNGDEYKAISGMTWLYYTDEAGKIRDMFSDVFFAMDASDPATVALRENINRTTYKRLVERLGEDSCTSAEYADILRPALAAKMETVKAIVASYNRDESNSQVDYFDRAIYDHYAVKII